MHHIILLKDRLVITMALHNEWHMEIFAKGYYLRVKFLRGKSWTVGKQMKRFHRQELQSIPGITSNLFPRCQMSTFWQHRKKALNISTPSKVWHFSKDTYKKIKDTFSGHASFAYGKICAYCIVREDLERMKIIERDDIRCHHTVI